MNDLLAAAGAGNSRTSALLPSSRSKLVKGMNRVHVNDLQGSRGKYMHEFRARTACWRGWMIDG